GHRAQDTGRLRTRIRHERDQPEGAALLRGDPAPVHRTWRRSGDADHRTVRRRRARRRIVVDGDDLADPAVRLPPIPGRGPAHHSPGRDRTADHRGRTACQHHLRPHHLRHVNGTASGLIGRLRPANSSKEPHPMTRTLIVGAGATGGALGARLIAAEQDVTFLVRERRAAQLAADGLRFRAPDVDGVHMARTVTALERADPFDLVIVTVKAPALEAIVSTLAPAIGPETRIVPLLNGMAHIDLLERAFPGQVLGGIVKIIAALDEDATVVQMTPLCNVTVGGLLGEAVPVDIRRTLDVDGIALEVVDDIASRLWEKWAFIAAAGVITCLFRGTIGDILAAGGEAQ